MNSFGSKHDNIHTIRVFVLLSVQLQPLMVSTRKQVDFFSSIILLLSLSLFPFLFFRFYCLIFCFAFDVLKRKSVSCVGQLQCAPFFSLQINNDLNFCNILIIFCCGFFLLSGNEYAIVLKTTLNGCFKCCNESSSASWIMHCIHAVYITHPYFFKKRKKNINIWEFFFRNLARTHRLTWVIQQWWNNKKNMKNVRSVARAIIIILNENHLTVIASPYFARARHIETHSKNEARTGKYMRRSSI